AQASCRWGHRTSCPVFQTPQATCPLLKIRRARRPLSPQTRCRGYHYNCERKGQANHSTIRSQSERRRNCSRVYSRLWLRSRVKISSIRRPKSRSYTITSSSSLISAERASRFDDPIMENCVSATMDLIWIIVGSYSKIFTPPSSNFPYAPRPADLVNG